MRILLLILIPFLSFGQGDYEKKLSGWVKYQKKNIAGRGVKVAVIDNGLNTAVIPVTYSYDYADNDAEVAGFVHGTYVASVIKDDSIGVAPGCDFYFFKVYDNAEGELQLSAAVEALRYCYTNDIDIVNISWYIGATTELNDIIDSLIDNDCIVIAAAGNSETESSILYPANLPGVVAVNTIKEDGTAFYLSVTGGEGIKISGSGYAVDVININGDPEINSGTSFSAPFIAGCLALLIEEYPRRTNRDILTHFLNKAVKADPVLYFGNGRVKL